MSDADPRLGQLLELIAEQEGEGFSAARACKRLGLSRSELQRMLVILGEDHALGALGLVMVEHSEGRQLLRLTEKARAAR